MKKKDLIRDPESSALATAWIDETNTLAAHAMVRWLKAGADTRRPIYTLSLTQMKALACTAWSTYIGALSERPRPAQTPEEEVQLSLWLG